MFICTCCASDVNAPQFYQGKVYGYTCILKVNPNAKRIKGNLWVPCEVLEKVEDWRTVTYKVKLSNGQIIRCNNRKDYLGVEQLHYFTQNMVLIAHKMGRVYKNVNPKDFK